MSVVTHLLDNIKHSLVCGLTFFARIHISLTSTRKYEPLIYMVWDRKNTTKDWRCCVHHWLLPETVAKGIHGQMGGTPICQKFLAGVRFGYLWESGQLEKLWGLMTYNNWRPVRTFKTNPMKISSEFQEAQGWWPSKLISWKERFSPFMD